MYRLHHTGINGKIDWLVENHYFEKRTGGYKKICIYPWNEEGIQIKQYLREMYNITNIQIFDDILWKYNSEVKNVDALKNMPDIEDMIFLGAKTEADKITSLTRNGVSEDNIFFLKGNPLRAQDALLKCCEDNSIHTVLDVGCGKGDHSRIFMRYGKEVTGIDAGFTCTIREDEKFRLINDIFEKHCFETTYDLVWCSHVLEHQQDIKSFICKLFDCCSKNGKVAITVPYSTIVRVVEGHVTCWNTGLLMYNIIQCGYSCRNAAVKTYAGNASVIVPKEEIDREKDYRASGDSRIYFPETLDCGENIWGGINFDGNIKELNWNK